MPLSIPEVPSYTEFASLASLPADHENSRDALLENTKPSRKWHSQAKALAENASVAVKNARKEWETISKTSPSKARTTHCEGWWRADVKNVQRACIAANIAVETAKKVVMGFEKDNQSVDLAARLKVEMGEHGKGYHPWWIVPKITVISHQ